MRRPTGSSESHKLTDVFTPTSPARLTFVERASLNDRLVNALQTGGKQLIVYGHSGSGKTTLLVNKLHQLYESHVTTRCIANLTFEHLVLDAFDQLAPFFEESQKLNTTERLTSAVESYYFGLKAQVGMYLERQREVAVKRAIPPQLTPQALGRFLGTAKCCWVLEDFHKTTPSEKRKLAQVMKVFMDMADEFPELKIAAIGAVDTAQEVVEYDPEMRNRIAEIRVPLMTDEEVAKIPEIGARLLNVSIHPEVSRQIVGFANGLPAVCHQLCRNLCVSADIAATLGRPMSLGMKRLDQALRMYLEEASATLKNAFDKAARRKRAGKFDNCAIILEALAELPQDGGTYANIASSIRKRVPLYPAGNLTYYLRELQSEARASILRCDEASGRYSFADPMHRAYALVHFAGANEAKRLRGVKGVAGRLTRKMLEDARPSE